MFYIIIKTKVIKIIIYKLKRKVNNMWHKVHLIQFNKSKLNKYY